MIMIRFEPAPHCTFEANALTITYPPNASHKSKFCSLQNAIDGPPKRIFILISPPKRSLLAKFSVTFFS